MTFAAFRLRVLMLLVVAVAALLTACDTGASALPTDTAHPNATSTPIPQVLYQADWSHGADGWTLPPHWSIKDGALVNDGGGTDSIPVPYTVTTGDYEIDLVARVLYVSMPLSCINLYGVQALDTDSNQLYYAQIYCVGVSAVHHPAASLLHVTAQGSDLISEADFFPNVDVKTYRIIVHNKGIRFYPNSSGSTTGINAPVTLSPATFNLLDQDMQLVITKFAILAESAQLTGTQPI